MFHCSVIKRLITGKLPVAMRSGEIPVPIPNTTVKTRAADDTMLETAWESRWLPEPHKKGSGERAYEIEQHQRVCNLHQRGSAVR